MWQYGWIDSRPASKCVLAVDKIGPRAPRVARYVKESQWHVSQQLTDQQDGSLIATFRLDNTEEIKRWILSFGKHATVLQPEEVRSEMRTELRQLLAAYDRDPLMGTAGRTRRGPRVAH
jgi:predicted DNA-binding transcriptional regulator YafY